MIQGMSTITVAGDGMTTIGPGIRVGIAAITTHDFGDGRGDEPATRLIVDHPAGTTGDEWLRAGSEVRAGEQRWRVAAIEGEGRLSGTVELEPL